jgi:hypothetical protein
MNSLTILVEGASIPELKEAIRLFQARCPGSNELSQNLSGILQFEEKNSREGLRGVVEGVCEAFHECREILEELLDGDEDAEEVSRSWVLDGSQEEDGSELEMARTKSKKNGKRNEIYFPLLQNRRSLRKSRVRSATQRSKMRKVNSCFPKSHVGGRTSLSFKRRAIFQAQAQRLHPQHLHPQQQRGREQ